MGMNPEFEDIAKSIQGKAVSLLSVGDGASQEAMADLLSLFTKIETACTLPLRSWRQSCAHSRLPPPCRRRIGSTG